MSSRDTLDRLLQLEQEARAAAWRLNRPEDPYARYEGTDPIDAVRVAVDNAGAVREVAIDRAWWEKVATGALGTAVQQAVAAAAVARLAAWTRAVAEWPDTSPPAAAGHLPDGLAGHLARRLSGPSASDLELTRAGIERQLQQWEDHAARTFTGRSPGRHAAVMVAGTGEVVGVEYHQQWLADATSTNIERATYQAFEAAYQVAGRLRAEELLAAGSLCQLPDWRDSNRGV